VLTSIKEELDSAKGQFDLIVDTVAAQHDLPLAQLKRDGTLILLSNPDKPLQLRPQELIFGRKQIAGSLTGGLGLTQEMLDFCAKHNIGADIELIPIQQMNDAYKRLDKGDVQYRFVIDIKSSLTKA